MNEQKLYQRIFKKKELLDSHRLLSQSILSRLKKELETELVYNSNAIEGNTLTLNETQLVLEEGITIKGKPLRDHLEAKNHMEALKLVEGLVQKQSPITENIINGIHKIVLKNIEEEFLGRYRPGQVRILGAAFIPPNALKVPMLMAELTKWINKNPDDLNIIEYASLAHYKFAGIHPYVDGNGRVARLLMNLLLMRAGFPPVVILNNDRKKYYNALNKADKGDFVSFFRLIAQSIERSLELYLMALGIATGDLLSLAEIAKGMPYSQEYLSLLVRQGKIAAIKLGRNWLTTQKAVHDYIQGRERKRN